MLLIKGVGGGIPLEGKFVTLQPGNAMDGVSFSVGAGNEMLGVSFQPGAGNSFAVGV